MEIVEVLKILLLFMLVIEDALILYDKKPEEKPKEERTSRRDVYGSFGDPLGDSYRRNTRRQYVPIIPNSKMLDGDDEE